MSVTFVPADEEALVSFGLLTHPYIKVLVIDESGPGVELRIMSDGEVITRPLERGVEHFRNSPLWVEVQFASEEERV